jgi:hypothetical protein
LGVFSIFPHFLNSDQEMGDTKVSIKGLHEDMRIFASEVTEESKSATDRVKKLGNKKLPDNQKININLELEII